jgi:hypothetical protein
MPRTISPRVLLYRYAWLMTTGASFGSATIVGRYL